MSIVAANGSRSQNGQVTHDVAVVIAGDATAQSSSLYATGKALMDLVLALCLSVVAAPLVLLAVIAIKLTSRGPPFTCKLAWARAASRSSF